ncbi:hypothetical protein [Longirhabdus pacifica]|uniref:hypothetical protein n=1 Tax=Longirhabdus pacifica TaxID=2305227 RepID=UPI001008A999|nr:hypothetical protein [Longirhabdus pacifica]
MTHITSYEKLKNILEENKDTPIKEVCAFQPPYMDHSLITMFGSIKKQNITIINKMQKETTSPVLKDILQLTYNEFHTISHLNKKEMQYFLEHLANIAIFSPEQPIDTEAYYSVKDLMIILGANEQHVIDQFERGRYKGSFIYDGEWLKPKPQDIF